MSFLGFTKDHKILNFDLLNDGPHHLVCAARTGSGKTGLLINIIEEAILIGTNCIIIDTKGDLANCCLPFHYLSGKKDEKPLPGDKYSYKNLGFWMEQDKDETTEIKNWIEAQTRDNVNNCNLYKDCAEFSIHTPDSPSYTLSKVNTMLSLTTELKPRVSVIYLRHLTDEQQKVIITNILENIKLWLKTSKSCSLLKNLLVVDEAASILPPAPKNPPTKEPLATIIAQARSQGLGVVIATQNPNDIDYKALSNVGTWFLGGLRKRDTQRDLKVIIEDKELDSSEIYNLPPRNFMALTKDGKATSFRSRCTMSYLAGPISLADIPKLNALHQKDEYKTGMIEIFFDIDPVPAEGLIGYLEFNLNGTWIACQNYLAQSFFTVNPGKNVFYWDTNKHEKFRSEVDIRLVIANKETIPILSKIKVSNIK